MEILSTRIMRGPNYWSNEFHKLIIVRLHDKISEHSTQNLDLIENRIIQMLPEIKLESKFSSRSLRMIEFYSELVIALQKRTGYNVIYSSITPTTEKFVNNIAIQYAEEEVALEACYIATEMIQDATENIPIDLEQSLNDLRRVKEKVSHGIYTESIISSIEKKNIPYRFLDKDNIILGYGKNQKRIKTTFTERLKPIVSEIDNPNIEELFPNHESSRIPIIAITGTNGKTTTSRLTAHIALTAGKKTGLTTTEGIYIQGKTIEKGDCTGPKSTEVVLNDPTVDFAVLECARGGILKSGLGFDRSDVSIITNLGEDHLQLKDINNMEEMTRVKEVVAKAVSETGYAVLNAEDDRTYSMSSNIKGNTALFALDPKNKRINEHLLNGGTIITIEHDHLVIKNPKETIQIADIKEIPITYNGTAIFNIQNSMCAAIACYLTGLTIEKIKEGLLSFYPTPEHIPGRMNLFQLGRCEIMIDYAHNAHGIEALSSYLKSVKGYKIGVISAAGDRRDEDIINLGRAAGKVFNEIVIRHDTDMRGRDKEELTGLLSAGIRQSGMIPIIVISDEQEAIKKTYSTAPEGGLITICSENIFNAIATVKELINAEIELTYLVGETEKSL